MGESQSVKESKRHIEDMVLYKGHIYSSPDSHPDKTIYRCAIEGCNGGLIITYDRKDSKGQEKQTMTTTTTEHKDGQFHSEWLLNQLIAFKSTSDVFTKYIKEKEGRDVVEYIVVDLNLKDDIMVMYKKQESDLDIKLLQNNLKVPGGITGQMIRDALAKKHDVHLNMLVGGSGSDPVFTVFGIRSIKTKVIVPPIF